MLTERQRDIYQFIRSHIHSKGYAPSVREIGRRFGIGSPNGVACHLRALKKKDWIDWEHGRDRSIRLLNEPKPGELLDLDGNVVSFAWLFEEGNYVTFVPSTGTYVVFNENIKVIGGIERVGN